MSEQIIKKIVLDIDGIEIGLTPEQAKKLHMALDEMLGVKQVEHIHHHDNYWNRPYIYWGTATLPKPEKLPYITYMSNSASDQTGTICKAAITL